MRLQLANNSITNAHLLSSLTNLNNVDITIPDPPPPEPPADVDPPGVTVSMPSGVQNGAFDATITFSETVSGFTQSDISLSGSRRVSRRGVLTAIILSILPQLRRQQVAL